MTNARVLLTLVPPEMLPDPDPSEFTRWHMPDSAAQREYFDSIVLSPTRKRWSRVQRKYIEAYLVDEEAERVSIYSDSEEDESYEGEHEDGSASENDDDGESEREDLAEEEVQYDEGSNDASDDEVIRDEPGELEAEATLTQLNKPAVEYESDDDWTSDSESESGDDEEEEIVCTGHRRPFVRTVSENEPVIPDFDTLSEGLMAAEASADAPVASRPSSSRGHAPQRLPPPFLRLSSPARPPFANYGKTKPYKGVHASAGRTQHGAPESTVRAGLQTAPVAGPSKGRSMALPDAVKGVRRDLDHAKATRPVAGPSSVNKRPALDMQPPESTVLKKRKRQASVVPASSKRLRRTATPILASPSDSEEEAARVEMKLEADDEDYVPEGSSAALQRTRKRRAPIDAGQDKEPRASKRRRVKAVPPVGPETTIANAADAGEGSSPSSIACKWEGCNKFLARKDLPQHVKRDHVVVPQEYQGKPGRYDVVCLWRDCPDRVAGAADHTVRLENLKKHLHSAIGTRYLCPAAHCDKSFSRVWRLNDHIRSRHPGQKLVTSDEALQAD
ncbi:hypothetical protein EVJ58_g2359 [Rhodofomes roseus]|uniref:C2H2-type domain-containing protein n=1 Tax=Rhodofomes roseus TaxID=34475 RepID=A0A4Y9YSU6_9APHY|nr:hypothetical protein EVJ58_g2359 [Rhodofomes roseus]